MFENCEKKFKCWLPKDSLWCALMVKRRFSDRLGGGASTPGYHPPSPGSANGHNLKKEKTAPKTVYRICTLRQIVLSRTQLQNILMEYFWTVQFSKPDLIGSNPIRFLYQETAVAKRLENEHLFYAKFATFPVTVGWM